MITIKLENPQLATEPEVATHMYAENNNPWFQMCYRSGRWVLLLSSYL